MSGTRSTGSSRSANQEASTPVSTFNMQESRTLQSSPGNPVGGPNPSGQAAPPTGTRQGMNSAGFYSSSTSPSTVITPPLHRPAEAAESYANVGSTSGFQQNPHIVGVSYLQQNFQNNVNNWQPIRDNDGQTGGFMQPALEEPVQAPISFSRAAQEHLARAPPPYYGLQNLLGQGGTQVEGTDNPLVNLRQTATRILLYETFLQLDEHMRVDHQRRSSRIILEGLNRRKYRSVKSEDDGEEELCSVCLDELVNGEYQVKLDCDHHYHFDCIRNWLERTNRCPICRNVAIPSA